MRWPLFRHLAIAIAACALSEPAVAVQPADGPGCIGVAAEECVRWLRATMLLNENSVAESMARRHQTDVNGRPLGGGFVTVYARLPERMEQFVILLHLRPDDTVERAESNLLHNLIEAHTEAVYDSSELYEIVWRLLGRHCPGISKLDLYRFFKNSVKPRITHQQEDFSSGLNGLHRVVSHADGVPYCGGVTLAYTNLLQWHGGNNPEAAAKKTQFSSIELR
jgi:hypothetical protein